jgi:uncharacterized membrane protein
MDERLRKRIIMFYAAGIVNAFLGLFILFEGPKYVPQETANWMVIFFLTFAAVDFYFPYAIRKKWEEEQARRRAGQSGGGTEVRGQK